MNSPVEEIKSEKTILLKNYLFENRGQTESLITYNQDGIFVMDLEGNIVRVNLAFEEILGYTSDEAIQLKLQLLFPIESLDKVFHQFHKASLGQFLNFDCKMSHKFGQVLDINITHIPISVNDQIVGILAVARDITELKRRREQNRKLEEIHHSLTDHVVDLIISTNLFGKILYASPSCEHILGCTTHELVGADYFSLFHQDDMERAQLDRKEILVKMENGMATYRIRRQNGTFVWVESRCKPIIDPETHRIIEVVSVLRDISNRKKTEEFLLNSEKLNIAGQLAAGIAHEVRNPLTAIKGFLQLMGSGENNKNYFEIIQSEMERIELILTELLVLAKPQDLKYEHENIKTIMENVRALIDTQANMNNVVIETKYKCENLSICCDKNQIKQVFINFFKNAIEAMDGGGVITVEINQYGNDKMKIFFKDNGKGIPPQVLNRIGEPFVSTKEDGTGLGIMISKQIIENHHGTVHFWSDEQGTIIEVILPIS